MTFSYSLAQYLFNYTKYYVLKHVSIGSDSISGSHRNFGKLLDLHSFVYLSLGLQNSFQMYQNNQCKQNRQNEYFEFYSSRLWHY